MNSDIYLFLLRQEGKFESLATQLGGGKMAIALKLPKWLKSFVMGDSLDLPFVKFIKVASVKHSVAFDGGGKELSYSNAAYDDGAFVKPWQMDGVSGRLDYAGRAVSHPFTNTFTRVDRSHGPATGRRENFETGNMFLRNHLPAHGSFSFTKTIDKATPQLAFGCSAQERFPFAIFFFRRRTGLGIEGSRMPYMVIGLDKVLVSSWSLDGDTESVTLAYKRIGWAATDQIADTNVSIPGFTRTWDVESRTGGEGGWALGLQALAAALAGMSGVLAKTVNALK